MVMHLNLGVVLVAVFAGTLANAGIQHTCSGHLEVLILYTETDMMIICLQISL